MSAPVKAGLTDVTEQADALQELRRGADPACIYSLAFSRGDVPEWLAVSSDKGTVHVFSLAMGERAAKVQQKAATNGTLPPGTANPVSALSFVSVRALCLASFACRRHFCIGVAKHARCLMGIY